jgi:beta-galactosidase/beta-glucuronidase
MLRDDNWVSLDGQWEWQQAALGDKMPFGTTLNQTILVPFPHEACLSGVRNATDPDAAPHYDRMWYRTMVTPSKVGSPDQDSRLLLHFGAVDWQMEAYIDGVYVGQHEGGYDPFTFDITDSVALASSKSVELVVAVFDPSNHGSQPFGKQHVEAMYAPGGDTYTPTSGIWQTVWLERVPSTYITSLDLKADMSGLNFTMHVNGGANLQVQSAQVQSVQVRVFDSATNTTVAEQSGPLNRPFRINIPSTQRKLWSPEAPYLYNVTATLVSTPSAATSVLDSSVLGSSVLDSVGSYFGLRSVSIGKDGSGVTRPLINGHFRFLNGFLDQSWWSDGLYTAPGDAALYSDLHAAKVTFGANMLRLHQKVNPERWYFYCDLLGIVVMQDIVGQIYAIGDTGINPRYWYKDAQALVSGPSSKANHPCIAQWIVFNEGGQQQGAACEWLYISRVVYLVWCISTLLIIASYYRLHHRSLQHEHRRQVGARA